MGEIKKIKCDVAVIGGGPAGISACLELSQETNLDIYLFENEDRLGGIPRSAHVFFGMRDLKRAYSGKAYAQRLETLLRQTSVNIRTDSTIIEIRTGSAGQRHCLTVSSPEGLTIYECRQVLLAMGCCEASRGSRLIPGTRPAGVITTGTLQKLVNLEHKSPGRQAVIVGSEHVAFSAALTLHKAGVKIKALVEPNETLRTYGFVANALSLLLGFRILKKHKVECIYGQERVEGVKLNGGQGVKEKVLLCDTLIVTGDFRPEATLLYDSGIELDPCTGGPVVDTELQTSTQGIWAAGNLLRGANMHDLCALEGRKAAKGMLKRIKGTTLDRPATVRITPEKPIRFLSPQKVVPGNLKQYRMPWLGSGYCFQVAHTINGAAIRALCGDICIWQKSYRRLIADSSYKLPVEKFNWSAAKASQDIRLVCVRE